MNNVMLWQQIQSNDGENLFVYPKVLKSSESYHFIFPFLEVFGEEMYENRK